MRARLSSNASEFSGLNVNADFGDEDNFGKFDMSGNWGDLSSPRGPPLTARKQKSQLNAILKTKLCPDDDFQPNEGPEETPYFQKVKIIFELSLPAVMCFLAGMIQENINLIFIGHLNDVNQMAGVGMGNMIQNMLGLSIVFGFNGAMETLVSQAYGSDNMKLCGVYLNRSRFVLLVSFIPISLVLFQSETILVALGQNPAVAKHA